jgi:hypothetical protein
MLCEIRDEKNSPPRTIIYGSPCSDGTIFCCLSGNQRIFSSGFRNAPKAVDQLIDAYSRTTPHNHGAVA